MVKIIKDLVIDLGSIAYAGEQRSFSVTGDDGAIFSLEIKNEDDHYYNFKTQEFTSTYKKLKNKKIQNGIFTSSINFPTVSDDDHYDIFLYAEPIFDTVQADYEEVRFGDGTVDINSSKGSKSNLLQKILYQFADTTITLSAIAPSTSRGTTDFTGFSVTTDTFTVGRGKTIGKSSFSVVAQAAATKAFQVARQPTENDLTAFTSVVFGDAVPIFREDAFTGFTARNTDTVDGATTDDTVKIVMDSNVSSKMAVGDKITGTATTDTIDGAVTSGVKVVMDNNVATKMAIGDRITGTGIPSSSVVTVAVLNPDGDNVKEFSMSEAVALGDGVTLTFSSELNRRNVTVVALNPDGDNVKEFSMSQAVDLFDGMTLTFTPPYRRRFNVAAASSIHKLAEGMIYVDSDFPTIDTVSISSFEDKTTYTTEVHNEDGTITEVENETIHVSLPGIDPAGNKPTIANGVVTKQLGNITFSDQVINDVDDTNTKYFYAYGPGAIKTVNNSVIKLSNLKAVITKPTTTTTAAVSNSATIPVADREGTIQNVSTVSGIGIAPGAVDPTVTSTTADGAGNWTLGVAQTLESGVTLTVENTSRIVTITGDIEFVNVEDANFTLYFDLEKFLIAS